MSPLNLPKSSLDFHDQGIPPTVKLAIFEYSLFNACSEAFAPAVAANDQPNEGPRLTQPPDQNANPPQPITVTAVTEALTIKDETKTVEKEEEEDSNYNPKCPQRKKRNYFKEPLTVVTSRGRKTEV